MKYLFAVINPVILLLLTSIWTLVLGYSKLNISFLWVVLFIFYLTHCFLQYRFGRNVVLKMSAGETIFLLTSYAILVVALICLPATREILFYPAYVLNTQFTLYFGVLYNLLPLFIVVISILKKNKV